MTKLVTVTLTFDLLTPKSIGSLGPILGSYIPSLVKVGHCKLKLLSGQGKMTKLVTVTLTFDLLTPKSIGFLGPILGSYTPSLVKLGHCKLKLLSGQGNDKIGHCDLDL